MTNDPGAYSGTDGDPGAYARPDPATPLSLAEDEDAKLWDNTLMDGLRDEPPFRTPPDFDAALGELECDQMNLDRCHDEWNKALVANDEAEAQLCEASVKIATSLRDASRQRVRELYEAVVRVEGKP